MTQIVLILLLVLLIIIALNYKKIKYNKTYKNGLLKLREFIDRHTKTKTKKKSKKKSKHNKNKINKDEQPEDNITFTDVLDESNIPNNNDNISLLSDISTIDINSLDSKDLKDGESLLSFD